MSEARCVRCESETEAEIEHSGLNGRHVVGRTALTARGTHRECAKSSSEICDVACGARFRGCNVSHPYRV